MRSDPTRIEVGQIWKSCDPREDRKIRIVQVDGDLVFCKNVDSGRISKIRKTRFRPISNGYRLLEDEK